MNKITTLVNKNNETLYPISISHAIFMEDGVTTLHEEIEEIKINNVKYDPITNNLIYFNGINWIQLTIDGTGEARPSGLTEDLVVAGVTVGNLTPGTVLNSGMSFTDVMKQMLIKVIPPTYYQPTLSLTSDITSAEIGRLIEPTLKATYTKNDGGEMLTVTIKDNGIIISENNSIKIPITLTSDKVYTASVTYSDGPVKNNNIGVEDANGQVKAGSKTASTTIKAYRAHFGFADSSSDIPTGDYIRGKNISGLNLSSGSTIKAMANENSRIICFAYPATLKDCSKIRYEELNDDNNKTAFSSIIVKINDASGSNPIDYRVYYYISPIPFGTNATFTLTV